MTPVKAQAVNASEVALGGDDAEINARAWALIDCVADSHADRVALLHASAILIASMALESDDPIGRATALVQAQVNDALELTNVCLAEMAGGPATDPNH
ncbi:MAG TPA: hypothetical protein PLI13_11760 [Paracoccus sp. (in: a-proteobacteria)]|nr:hypothetical protein [Paracoccus sp. (in: a-proteobacteria)]